MRPTGPTRRAAASSLSTFLQWVNPHLHQGAGPPLPLPFRGPYGLGLRAPPPPGNHQGRGSDRPPCYKAGETLLTIPVALWGPVSADFALEQATTYAPHIHDALGSAGRGLVTPMALALHLGLALLDETDPIHPYVRFLYQSSQEDDPGASSPHPLLLGGDALRGLFQASPVVPALEKRQRIYASIHQQLFPQPGPPPALPFPVFLWAVSRILSRAISGPGRPLTLVPYFDLLNHSAYFNCDYEVSFGPERCDVVVHATRDVRHDEELFLSYGDDKDNHCLLTTYGFVERGNPNPVQIAITTDGGEEDEQQPPPLPSSLPPPTPKQRALLQRLGADDALDASAEWPPLMVGGAPPDDALARALAARVVLATPATASTAFPAALEGAALAKAVLAAAPRAERARVLDGARQALEARLRAYDTAAEEDEVELEGVGKGENAGDAVGGLRASALVLRIEEKEALAAAAAWVDAQSRK